MKNIKKMKNWKEVKDELIKRLEKLEGVGTCKIFRSSESIISVANIEIGLMFDIEKQIIKFWGKASVPSASYEYTIKDMLEIESTFKKWSNEFLR